jgi:hypothetical protein
MIAENYWTGAVIDRVVGNYTCEIFAQYFLDDGESSSQNLL